MSLPKAYLRGLTFASEQSLPVIYKGLRLNCGFRVDLIVAEAVVVEIKAVERLAPVPLLREGIRRRVLGLEE